ncbi:hypothetical protein SDC9_97186 [bioreactor metagenome]|uniref:Uncharacterized protein n=1 Tax=bioreactor metagenome TaxID=1076179 RepID=A0A645ABP4_9ZZZZ
MRYRENTIAPAFVSLTVLSATAVAGCFFLTEWLKRIMMVESCAYAQLLQCFVLPILLSNICILLRLYGHRIPSICSLCATGVLITAVVPIAVTFPAVLGQTLLREEFNLDAVALDAFSQFKFLYYVLLLGTLFLTQCIPWFIKKK